MAFLSFNSLSHSLLFKYLLFSSSYLTAPQHTHPNTLDDDMQSNMPLESFSSLIHNIGRQSLSWPLNNNSYDISTYPQFPECDSILLV